MQLQGLIQLGIEPVSSGLLDQCSTTEFTLLYSTLQLCTVPLSLLFIYSTIGREFSIYIYILIYEV